VQESDFQNCHIIIFKCIIFNGSHNTCKETGKEKIKSKETVPEKDIKADLLYKDLKAIVFKILQEVKNNVEK
jgi:hypothetical protein